MLRDVGKQQLGAFFARENGVADERLDLVEEASVEARRDEQAWRW